MNIYESRWNNAKRIAEKINKFIDEGYVVLDDEGSRVIDKFIITENEISRKIDNYELSYFIADRDCDEGLYTTIEKYNARFFDWIVIDPKHINKIV